ncbi:MAG: TPM domain-containing protein [Eubacteriales bacterium]|nr:TPM domain-containing protein [Eubacteriales bacterium]
MAHSGGGGSHGGGSHGGGSHSGGSGGGVARSTKYFSGSYYHSYVDRRGKSHVYYSSQKHVPKPDKSQMIMTIISLTVFLLVVLFITVTGYIDTTHKLNDTTPDVVRIYDEEDFFTDSEEQVLSDTLEEYYQQTGVNAVVCAVSNSQWKIHYASLEKYAMEKYYELFSDEKHYLVVFSNEMLEDGWQDWYFETIVGDDTTRAIGPTKESYMVEQIQNQLWNNDNNAGTAIHLAFQDLIAYSSTTHIDWSGFGVFALSFLFLGALIYVAIDNYKKSVEEYNYFLQHPESIKNPAEYHLQCPNCSAPNTKLLDACEYCGTVLHKGNPNVNEKEFYTQ